MPDNRETRCSVCGQTIKTVRGAIRLKTAPLVCRRCFGEQTYATTTAWKFPVAGAEASAEN